MKQKLIFLLFFSLFSAQVLAQASFTVKVRLDPGTHNNGHFPGNFSPMSSLATQGSGGAADLISVSYNNLNAMTFSTDDSGFADIQGDVSTQYIISSAENPRDAANQGHSRVASGMAGDIRATVTVSETRAAVPTAATSHDVTVLVSI